MDHLIRHVEALIFCSEKPITPEQIRQCLIEMYGAELPESDIHTAIEHLKATYQSELFSFEVVSVAGGLQFMTKPAYQSSISILLRQMSKKRLSKAALETLSIVAYKQPVSRPEIEQIRGVNCDYAIRKLLDRELIAVVGKSDGVGRPVLYGTSGQFLEYFGINSLSDLPMPKDFTESDVSADA